MRLSDWLKENNVSNAEFGRRIDRTAEAIRRYASGDRIPDRETMPLIAEATGGVVTANDFYGTAPADGEPPQSKAA